MNTSAIALAAALAGVSLAGCTAKEESASVAFSAVCALTDDCTFAPTCTAQYIGDYVYDAALANDYWVVVQVNNQLANNADPSSGRVNSNDAHITSIEVTYENFALGSSSTGSNFKIPAAGASSVVVKLVPLQATVPAGPAGPVQAVARVVGKGYFENGSSFETGEFPVPFIYCDGCLAADLSCPAGTTYVQGCGATGVLPTRFSCAAP